MELAKKKKKMVLLGCISLSLMVFSMLYLLHPHKQSLDFQDHRDKDRVTSQTNDIVRKDPGIWTIKPGGRMGNHLGQYAALYALAKANARQAFILTDMYNLLAPIFKITLPVLENNVASRVKFQEYWIHNWMSEEYNHIDKRLLKLVGYPSSWTFYHHLRDEIRREFTIHDYLKDEANQVLKGLKASRKNVTYIGVHVRRGDYVTFLPKVRQGVVADKGYMEKAMNYFRNKYEEPVFVVTSNGMDWCKENIDSSKGDVFFSGDGNETTPGMDFALLVACNHTIMTVGTFGLWASYLVGGETVYLTNYTLPESPFLKTFHYKDVFLPEWIGIAADLSPLKHKN